MSSTLPPPIMAGEKTTGDRIVDSMDLIFPIEDRKRILEGEVESLTEKLEMMAEKSKVSNNNLRNVKLTLSAIKKECTMLEKENSEHLKNLASISKDNLDLIQAAKKDHEDLEKYELDVIATNEDLLKMGDEIEEKKKVIATQETKITSLEADVEAHKAICNHIAEVNEDLTKKCEEYKATIDSQIENSSETSTTKPSSADDNKPLRGEIEGLRDENENLREENERLRGESLRGENESLRKDKDDLVLSQQVLKQEVTKLREIVFEQPQRNNKGWCTIV